MHAKNPESLLPDEGQTAKVSHNYPHGLNSHSPKVEKKDVPAGHRTYDELQGHEKRKIKHRTRRMVIDRFAAPTVINDLPVEIQEFIISLNANDPLQVLWEMAKDPTCVAWVEGESDRLAEAMVYPPAQPENSSVPVYDRSLTD